ncbi:hypothetical protein PRB05_18870, partial [Klebsiella pneumoniae]|uniref:hypothetical protein n=1 Tax=Klebsiella pneumoniae TaxID=573 RepID=UPI002E81A891
RHGHSSGYSLTGTITTSLGGGLGVTIKTARDTSIAGRDASPYKPVNSEKLICRYLFVFS